MNKGSSKKYDAKRAEVVKFIAKEMGITEGYVRQCIAGTAHSGRAEEIKRAFNKKYAEVQQVLS